MPNKHPPVAQDTCEISVSPHTGKLVLGPTKGSLQVPSPPWPWEATGSPGRLPSCTSWPPCRGVAPLLAQSGTRALG